MSSASETIGGMESVMRAAGGQVIGAVVMWSLAGVRVRRDALREQLAEIGLESALGRDPGPEGILKRAVKTMGRKGLIIRHRRRGEYALVEEHNPGEGKPLEHHHTVTMRVKTQVNDVKLIEWVAEQPDVRPPSMHAAALANRILEECETIRVHATTDDISVVLVRAVAGAESDVCLGGLSLRDRTGGVYWVPGPSVERMAKLRDLVHGLPGESHVQVLTLYGDADNLREAAEMACASFTAQLNELREELVAFSASLKESGNEPSDHNVRTRVKRLQRLGERVDLWSDALGDVQTELKQRIEDAKAEVAEQLGL